LELKVIKAKPYVRLQYLPVEGKKEYCEKIRELSGADGGKNDEELPDFLEVTITKLLSLSSFHPLKATVFDKNRAVITVGTFARVNTFEEKRKVNRVTLWYKPWWYKHVETFLTKV